jgi:hypothetical protein
MSDRVNLGSQNTWGLSQWVQRRGRAGEAAKLGQHEHMPHLSNLNVGSQVPGVQYRSALSPTHWTPWEGIGIINRDMPRTGRSAAASNAPGRIFSKRKTREGMAMMTSKAIDGPSYR